MFSIDSPSFEVEAEQLSSRLCADKELRAEKYWPSTLRSATKKRLMTRTEVPEARNDREAAAGRNCQKANVNNVATFGVQCSDTTEIH